MGVLTQNGLILDFWISVFSIIISLDYFLLCGMGKDSSTYSDQQVFSFSSKNYDLWFVLLLLTDLNLITVFACSVIYYVYITNSEKFKRTSFIELKASSKNLGYSKYFSILKISLKLLHCVENPERNSVINKLSFSVLLFWWEKGLKPNFIRSTSP